MTHFGLALYFNVLFKVKGTWAALKKKSKYKGTPQIAMLKSNESSRQKDLCPNKKGRKV